MTRIGVKGRRRTPDERMITRVAAAVLSLADKHIAGYHTRPATRGKHDRGRTIATITPTAKGSRVRRYAGRLLVADSIARCEAARA